MSIGGANFETILQRRYGRRDFLRAALLGAAASALPTISSARDIIPLQPAAADKPSTLNFTEVSRTIAPTHEVAASYTVQPLIRWGDALLPSAKGPFDAATLSAQAQAERFGYNNDFLAYLPLRWGEPSNDHGLLHVNHEYTNATLMFPAGKDGQGLSIEQMRVEQAAQGGSLLEIRRHGDSWQPVMGSPFARRLTANTPMKISGPAAGHKRMQTAADPSGEQVLGTFANCSGGVTPWGTVLMAEENIDGYFHGQTEGAEATNHQRYDIGRKSYYGWHQIDIRFDVKRTPQEPNRFGWVVEYDPYDPQSVPVKRTALGRFKHESASCTLAPDGRVVVYSGDDDEFEYLYRFVSKGRVNLQDRAANRDLLDEGTLSVARFDTDGTLEWLPLRHGKGPLTSAEGFHSQADVLIETRRAADLLGATPMDRPEGIAIHPQSQSVYASLTKNKQRDVVNVANPRLENKSGHIIRFHPPAKDHTATHFRWDLFILAGNPASEQTTYSPEVSERGWFACPDNLTFDPQGRLWVATDGMESAHGVADGLYATEVNGAGEALPKAFFRAPVGAESCSPTFTPDGKTMFLSIQHPGEGRGSSYDTPATRWPDFKDGVPPRPTVVAIMKGDGGVIGV